MNNSKHPLALAVLVLAATLTGEAQTQQASVRAVLFYSPTCGHCHYVITEVLPPLAERYGDQLQIAGVNIASTGGQVLYQAAIEHFEIPDERRGVPTLIVDTTVLVGSQEIPERFPGLIEQYLAAGGVDWPAVPGLAEALAASRPAPTSTPIPTPEQAARAASDVAEASQATAASSLSNREETVMAQPDAEPIVSSGGAMVLDESTPVTLGDTLRRDPIGNLLSILLLVGMLGVLAFAVVRAAGAWPSRTQGLLTESPGGWQDWAVAGLCLVGLGVSIYMAVVETTDATAVCGPIGDCNTVQQSDYAQLFGRIPVGVLGILGYLTMLAAWAARRWGRGRVRGAAGLALFGMALFGTLFSIYLTFLEPFIIGATCAWCLTSALCMTLILWILAGSISVQTKPVAQAR